MFERNHISAGFASHGEGTALRAIGWPELAARINAARDLREVLQRDNATFIASFADAAAGYFGTLDEGKPDVNPDALCDRKSSFDNDLKAEGDQNRGDREK